MSFPSSSRILEDDLHVGRDKMGKILWEVRWMESGALRKWQSGQINHCHMQPSLLRNFGHPISTDSRLQANLGIYLIVVSHLHLS